jgi:DNA repair protein RadC
MRLVMTRVEAVNLSAEGIASCDMVEITNSDLAHTIFSPFFADHLCAYEAVRIILLDPQNHARGVVTIGQGGIAQTTADHRLLFAAALTTLSPAVIIAHNHPSGKLVPSRADIDWTRKACQIGELHEITVRDHLILGMNGYYSMADKGLL